MEKWLSLATIAAAGLVMGAFALDLSMGIPFGRLNFYVDVLSIAAAALVAFLGWDSYRDQR